MSAEMSSTGSLHGAYVARQCPVRVFRDRDPFEAVLCPQSPMQRSRRSLTRVNEFEAVVVETLAEIYGDDLVRIATRGRRQRRSPRRGHDGNSHAARRQVHHWRAPRTRHRRPPTERSRPAHARPGQRGRHVDASLYWPIDIKHHRATKHARQAGTSRSNQDGCQP